MWAPVPTTAVWMQGGCVPIGWSWACGVMTLAMGSCLYGVLEIYGTSSGLVWPYLPVGFGLLVLAGACF